MADDSLIIIASLISVVIFIELIVALILCIKCSDAKYKRCLPCFKGDESSSCFSKEKVHRYKIRRSSIQTASSKTESRSASVDNKVNLILPFPIKPNIVNSNVNNNSKIYTIDSEDARNFNLSKITSQNEIANTYIKQKAGKNRMNSYLYAINYKNIMSNSERDHIVLKKANNMLALRLSEDIEGKYKQNLLQKDIDNNSNLNSDSPISDNSIPSPPSSLNLVSLSRCPSPPAPLAVLNVYPSQTCHDFESQASDGTNQIKFMINNNNRMNSNLNALNENNYDTNFTTKIIDNIDTNNILPISSIDIAKNGNNKRNSEVSLLSSINFIRFYLDKLDTQMNHQKPNSSNINTNTVTSNNNNNNINNNSAKNTIDFKINTSGNDKILNEYLNGINTDEIIENAIRDINSTRPVINRPN